MFLLGSQGLYPAASPASDVLLVVTTAQSWEPSRFFWKMGRLALLRMKKATTQLLSSWRNGDHNLFEISNCEDLRKAQKIQIKVKIVFSSVKTLMSTLDG